MIEFLFCYKRVRLKKAVVFKEKELNLSKRSDNLYSDCFGKIPDFRRLQKSLSKAKTLRTACIDRYFSPVIQIWIICRKGL